MKTIRFVSASIVPVLALAGAGHAQYLSWVDQFGTGGLDYALSAAPDGAGGVYSVGYTSGSLGGPNQGGSDAFVARHDHDGSVAWITQLGSNKSDRATAALADGAGGVFVAGETEGAEWGPNMGKSDLFLARLDASGQVVWVTQTGTPASDQPWGLAPDDAGGVFVAGSVGLQGDPAADILLAHFDGDGNLLWWHTFGTGKEDQAWALAPDANGGVFIAGDTRGDLGGPNTGDADAFLARFDSSGQQTWMRQFGTPATDWVKGLTADGAGGVFVGGFTSGDLGGPNLGQNDACVARFDADGSQLWLAQFGTSQNDFVHQLVPDDAGGVLAAGYTYGTLGDKNFGSADVILVRLDDSGQRTWVAQAGTNKDDFPWGLASDGSGGAFPVGQTYGDFGNGNLGSSDVFVMHFSTAPCAPDCDGSGSLDLFDYLCFVNMFNAVDPAADCTGDGTLDLFDYLCFVDEYDGGC